MGPVTFSRQSSPGPQVSNNTSIALAIVSANGVDHCRLAGDATGDEGAGSFDVVCHLFAIGIAA